MSKRGDCVQSEPERRQTEQPDWGMSPLTEIESSCRHVTWAFFGRDKDSRREISFLVPSASPLAWFIPRESTSPSWRCLANEINTSWPVPREIVFAYILRYQPPESNDGPSTCCASSVIPHAWLLIVWQHPNLISSNQRAACPVHLDCLNSDLSFMRVHSLPSKKGLPGFDLRL